MIDNDNAKKAAYETYMAWHGWEGAPDPVQNAEVFCEEVRRAKLKPGARILEVGFGGGAFLDWARNNSFTVHGVEIVSDFVEAARVRGHQVWLGNLADMLDQLPGEYDAIFVLDVLEHLTKPQIVAAMRHFHRLLAPTGLVVARFPNGTSPFGRMYQHGDFTHETVLSADMMRQIGSISGFSLELACNAARTYHGGTRRNMRAVKALAYGMRTVFEIFLGYLYFGCRMPLDVNLTVFMRRISN